jgi:hypothetical protein
MGMAGADSIIIRPGDEHYCVDCIFYLAVYGFKDSDYSIVAASGMTMLTCGTVANGIADANEMVYYSYYHSGERGDLEIIMTALTGDPDLYVTAGAGAAVLPTVDDYIWAARKMGSDGLLISKDDPNYCENCEYNIGVFAWSSPSTFTLMMNGGECMMNLLPGRPQAGNLDAGEMKYYKMTLRTGADDLQISLTVGYGGGDIYVKELRDGQQWNRNDLPVHDDQDSYDYTSAGVSNDELLINGPHDGTRSEVK